MPKLPKKDQPPNFWDIIHGNLPPLGEGKWFTTGERVVFRAADNNQVHPQEGKVGVVLAPKGGLFGIYQVLFDGETEPYTCTGAELFKELA